MSRRVIASGIHRVMRLWLLAWTVSSTVLASTARADETADFYKGKQIRFIIGTTPGGAYDLYARAIARHMGNHLPGNPTFIPQNMDGAGGRTAGNWLYNIAP